MKPVEQVFLFVGVLLGVLIGQVIDVKFTTLDLTKLLDWKTFLVSLVIAIVIIPQIYKQLQVDPTSPWIVRFFIFVQNGIFWRSIVGGISKQF